ncbi:5'-3' exoribonuclease 1 [Trichonephila inaurata madagascariensis]|uniref:5'-3' exoribonuclease 1 n=1 Tax=Trichonephila inaurata madagascariensis TaxID=2747483 RepID=A0A8X6KGB1_9ARAC|nr:5'-3' exoribonuclease 1 [Trichonephila inaurata madagascariensis]
MNGIIHTCSHPNDDDPHFRITEETIFANICYYIEFLFKIIKPKKVFFMAVDGVAPRAKMNQQRGRRFRTAKTAAVLEEEARASGEQLPTEARFDSNCITPGTAFMSRLHDCLKGFVVHKVSTDKLWRNVRVYLSGHETPGEGEHKIMDFIRYEKSQPGYNPNTRHCLYGLDADLIMLGLCSHEPHFSLLREEVKFGSKTKQKRITTPEETTFHLLHISLLRDYLGHEFSPVKTKISFSFDLEKVIDDFVLMSFLVGNDFIPHLPQLHIHHDALPLLFQTYMDVLPTLGGYINEEGFLNLERFELFMVKLAEYDFKKFEEMNDDFQYLEGKSKSKKSTEACEKISTTDRLADLGFSSLAISQIAEFDTSDEEDNSDEESTLELEFNMHKVDYYMNKLDYAIVTPEVLKDQAEGYVRAIQWNLHYYYNGVVSWSWYYPHHYSPYISDVKDFKDMVMKFELGKPFLPFQQLLAVLPKLSKELLPEPYQKLMCDIDSQLIDFYPDDFTTDLNGKQQEWEAVVLIPFINEKILCKSAELADKLLTEEEKKRNSHGPHLLYTYCDKSLGPAPSFLPGHYPPIHDVHARVSEIHQDFFRLPSDILVKGLCKGVVMDKFILGFPSLRTLKHSAFLKNEKVKVFQMVSLKDNMMLKIEEEIEDDINKICEKILGKTVYVGWPHLREAFVSVISNDSTKYSCEKRSRSSKFTEEKMSKEGSKIWECQTETVQETNYQRWGIFIGDVKILVHVKCLSGSKLVITKEGKVKEEKQFEGMLSNYALQTIVSDVEAFAPDVEREKTVEDIFQPGSTVFVLVPQYYGSIGKVIDCDQLKSKDTVQIDIEITSEPDLLPVIQNQDELKLEQFMPAYIAAQQLGMETHFVSRLTGTFLVQTSPKGSSSPNRVNIGLNLKFNHRNEEVQGFSKKVDNQWLYSEECVKILNAYLGKFADFFERLYNYIGCDVVYIEELYPNGEGIQIIKEMANWLKEQPCSRADRQSCDIKKLDNGIVNAIEKAVLNAAKDDVFHIKKGIPPAQLYIPYTCKGVYIPDSRTTFHLFDRVINVCPTSSVPLGLKGTIIGIQTATKESDYIYEIVFDKEFSGGIALPSGSRKAYRMPPNGIINLSHGERLHKQSRSPSKNVKKVIPRLNKNSIFDSAIKQLQTDISPVHILQKKPSVSASLQTKPFYKVDTTDMFHTSDTNYVSPVFSPTWSNSKQFVTPKANRLSGGFINSTNNIIPQNVPSQSDLRNFWADLKKAPESPSNKQGGNGQQTKATTEQGYGQKVSIEELFQGAQNHIETKQLQNVQMMQSVPAPAPNMLSSKEAVDALRIFCLDHLKAPPLYSYHNFGSTNLFTATVSLPNGEKVSSTPSPNKFEAAADASFKALAFLKTKIPPPFTPNQNYLNNASNTVRRPVPPLQQPNFQPDYRPFLFGPPPYVSMNNFPRPPNVIPPFNSCFDPPVLRHPPPIHSTHIPDSYVKANQIFLLDTESSYSDSQTAAPPTHHNNMALLGDREVVHLPGGGIASVRNPQLKTNDSGNSSMFVPAQVIKQAIKTPNDSSLSNTDWPDLPLPKEIHNPLEKTPSKSQNSPKDKTKNYAHASKSSQSSSSDSNQAASQSSNMTILKKSKRRIAANFQNP